MFTKKEVKLLCFLSIQGEQESAAARATEARRRALARRKAQKQQIRGADLRLRSPPPVAGRRHEPVQTCNYLEELFDNPPVTEICTQTDFFLDRPRSPYYIPRCTGIDAETQIYPGDVSPTIRPIGFNFTTSVPAL